MKDYLSLECQNGICQDCKLDGCTHDCHLVEFWESKEEEFIE